MVSLEVVCSIVCANSSGRVIDFRNLLFVSKALREVFIAQLISDLGANIITNPRPVCPLEMFKTTAVQLVVSLPNDVASTLLSVVERTSHAKVLMIIARDLNVVLLGSHRPPIVEASGHGRLNVVKELLAHMPHEQAFARDATGATAMIVAAKNGRLEVVKELLSRAPLAQLAACDYNGDTALKVAVANGQREVVALLAAHDLAPQLRTTRPNRTNAFNYCVALPGNADCVEILAPLLSDQQLLATFRGCSPLALAVCDDNAEVVEKLLATRPQLQIERAVVGSRDSSLIGLACRRSTRVLGALIACYPRDQLQASGPLDKFGTSPLTLLAKMNGAVESVEALIAHSPGQLLSVSMDGRFALGLASFFGHAEIVDALLVGCAPGSIRKQLELRDNEGQTALMLAVRGCHVNIVHKLLLFAKLLPDGNAILDAQMQAADATGQSVITMATRACRKGDDGVEVLVVLKLLEYATARHVQVRDDRDNTPLIWACSREQLTITEALLAICHDDAYVLAKNVEGMTALMFAADRGDLPLVKTLLTHVLDYQLASSDNHGMTALTFAGKKWNTR